MFECKLKSGSWHYWVANFGNSRVGSETDICEYTRSFFKGLFWLFIVGLGVGVAVTFFGMVVYNIYDMIVNGASIAPPTIVLFGVVGGLALIAGIVASKERYVEYREDKLREERSQGIVRQPGFIALAYRKFKERTCFKIKFE